MNLLVKKLWPPVAIILAAVLVISCEDPGKIGLIIDEDNGLLKTGFREFVLPTSVVQFDPRSTMNSQSYQVGHFYDDDFGDVYYKTYSQLVPSLVVDINSNAEYTSFTMSISFTGMTGPVPQNKKLNYIDIYQLAEPIDSTVNYLRTDELALGTKLGVWEFEPYVDDTLQTDSVFIINLDDGVGEALFQKLKEGDPIFENSADFNAYFNGVSFETGIDASHIFRLNTTEIRFTLNYTESNSSGNPVERTYTLSLGENHFNNITSDLSGTPLAGLMPDNTEFVPANDRRYIQSGSMIAIRADLSAFQQLTDTIEHVVINKAEVVFSDVQYTSEYNTPPSPLFVYFTDETNQWPFIDYYGRVDASTIGEYYITLQDESIYVPPSFYGTTNNLYGVPPGLYGYDRQTDYDEDSLNGSYSFVMSHFFQNLYTGNFTSATEPFLEEKGQVYFFTGSSVLYPTRTESHLATNGLSVHKDSIKLRVHYSYPSLQQVE